MFVYTSNLFFPSRQNMEILCMCFGYQYEDISACSFFRYFSSCLSLHISPLG